MSYTIEEVAQRTGKTPANLRKMVQRGQLRSAKEGGKLVITEEGLEDLMGSEILDEAAEAVRGGRTGEVGNLFARMPSKLANAILEGMGSSKPVKAPSPEPVRKALAQLPKYPVVEVPSEEEDPHRGFPIGHKHVDTPRWKRTSKSTWSLGGGSYTWNGFLWEGGGSRSDTTLEPGISPADPDTHYRPLAPAVAVKA